MRKKLILILVLMVIAVIFINISKSKQVFVKSTEDVKVYTDKDIKKSDDLLSDLSRNEKYDIISNVTPKYGIVTDKKETQFCGKEDNTYLVSKENGFDVISYQNGDTFEYYRASGNNCDLIGKISDVNFTDNSNETYANDSVYTNLDSFTNFDLSGLIRIKGEELKSYDTVFKRYSNPIAFEQGILLIENNNTVVAFDKDDKAIFKQNNAKGRNVLAINRTERSLFMIVSVDKKYSIEAYKVDDTESIKNAKPELKYDITNYLKNVDFANSKFVMKNSPGYASFTIDGMTLVTSGDLAKIFVLNKADTTIEIVDNMIVLKDDELYYVVDLSSEEREDIGSIKALSLRTMGKDLYFSVLDNKQQEAYIKYALR